MVKVTQEMFDAFEVINGVKQCPSGDYSEIKTFMGPCSFGERASFGRRASFGERASFGKGASFGRRASFGEGASFGERASFGEGASFGERASFENGHEAADHNQPFYKFSGFSSRRMSETYVFNCADGIFVRCGCFFGTVGDFKKRVIEEKGEDHGYLKIVDLYVDEIKKR